MNKKDRTSWPKKKEDRTLSKITNFNLEDKVNIINFSNKKKSQETIFNFLRNEMYNFQYKVKVSSFYLYCALEVFASVEFYKKRVRLSLYFDILKKLKELHKYVFFG